MNEKMLSIVLNANSRHMYVNLVDKNNITKEVALKKLDDLFQYGCENFYEPLELHEAIEETKNMVVEFFNPKLETVEDTPVIENTEVNTDSDRIESTVSNEDIPVVETKHLNPNRINVEGKFRMINIICDVNMILPKELQLSLSQRAILIDIWSNSDSNYQSIISNKTISLHTGMNIRTVERVLPELVDLGWIINVRRRYHNSVVRQLAIPDKIMKLIEEDLSNTNDNRIESTVSKIKSNRIESTVLNDDRTINTVKPYNEYSQTVSKIQSNRIESTDYNNSNIIIDINNSNNSNEYEQNNTNTTIPQDIIT
ncbi:hypothetical protein GMC17_14370, partial [Turicibacter sanguinis]|nr:hypothetical protein [Turicibacter sanguinis]